MGPDHFSFTRATHPGDQRAVHDDAEARAEPQHASRLNPQAGVGGDLDVAVDDVGVVPLQQGPLAAHYPPGRVLGDVRFLAVQGDVAEVVDDAVGHDGFVPDLRRAGEQSPWCPPALSPPGAGDRRSQRRQQQQHRDTDAVVPATTGGRNRCLLLSLAKFGRQRSSSLICGCQQSRHSLFSRRPSRHRDLP